MASKETLDKIKKVQGLFASPHEGEAGNARRLSASLMEKHGVSQAEVDAHTLDDDAVPGFGGWGDTGGVWDAMMREELERRARLFEAMFGRGKRPGQSGWADEHQKYADARDQKFGKDDRERSAREAESAWDRTQHDAYYRGNHHTGDKFKESAREEYKRHREGSFFDFDMGEKQAASGPKVNFGFDSGFTDFEFDFGVNDSHRGDAFRYASGHQSPKPDDSDPFWWKKKRPVDESSAEYQSGYDVGYAAGFRKADESTAATIWEHVARLSGGLSAAAKMAMILIDTAGPEEACQRNPGGVNELLTFASKVVDILQTRR